MSVTFLALGLPPSLSGLRSCMSCISPDDWVPARRHTSKDNVARAVTRRLLFYFENIGTRILALREAEVPGTGRGITTLASVRSAGPGARRPHKPATIGTNSHGTVYKRHQEYGRSVRAHAARHLLCRKADREVVARHDREGQRSPAQARFPDPPARNREPREAPGTSF